MRDMLFLSHANPEDNEFTRWLALQLAKNGYPAWCDLTKLLGGEDFWADIERAIRDRTLKFLYILSRTSNVKIGPLQELHVAHGVMRQFRLKDFIIPLLIDDLPYQDINIELTRLNAISFYKNWAGGLRVLLDKLQRDHIPLSPNFNPNAVADWWRAHTSAEETVTTQPEDYLSNWFPIEALPPKVYFHRLERTQIGKITAPTMLPCPAIQHQQYLVSFAEADDFKGHLGPVTHIAESHDFATQDLLDGNIEKKFISREKKRDVVYSLLKLGWEQMAAGRKLQAYTMARGAQCFYFVNGLVENNVIHFRGAAEVPARRNIIGFRSQKNLRTQAATIRYWHFGIQAKPIVYPTVAFIIKPHVLFSDDGIHIWDSAPRLHRARRSQCRNWWNADWRDRILAVVSWLANGQETITVPMGNGIAIQFAARPVTFTSPVSYTTSQVASALLAPDAELDQVDESDDEFDDEFDDEGDEEE